MGRTGLGGLGFKLVAECGMRGTAEYKKKAKWGRRLKRLGRRNEVGQGYIRQGRKPGSNEVRRKEDWARRK